MNEVDDGSSSPHSGLEHEATQLEDQVADDERVKDELSVLASFVLLLQFDHSMIQLPDLPLQRSEAVAIVQE